MLMPFLGPVHTYIITLKARHLPNEFFYLAVSRFKCPKSYSHWRERVKRSTFLPSSKELSIRDPSNNETQGDRGQYSQNENM